MSVYVCAQCGCATRDGLAVARQQGAGDATAVYVALCDRERCVRAGALRIGDYYREANLALVHLSRQQFGHQGWMLLHALADAYEPRRDAASVRAFLAAFVHAYPCALCRSHLAPMVAAHPPALESRDALMRWVCARHNQVNARLGKPHVRYVGMPAAPRGGGGGDEDDSDGVGVVRAARDADSANAW